VIAVELLFGLFVFAFGAILGSFANVCIHRLPRGESVVHPPSRCPACGERIAFYDNVPILSFLLLRGRCRRCQARISWRYPVVEACVAFLLLAVALRWGPTPAAVAGGLLAAVSVILIWTDLESRVLPDEITIGTLVLAVVLSGVRTLLERPPGAALRFLGSPLAESLLGAACGAGLLLAVRAGYKALRGAEGMGLGDVKMIAMIGALTGPAGVLVTLLFGSVTGSLAGGGGAALRRLSWVRAERRARRGEAAARAVAGTGGLLIDGSARVTEASAAWREVPGAAPAGQPVTASGPVARPLVAFIRLARRRAARGQATACGRLALDDGADFFRVLSVRAVPAGEGLLVLMGRADIPFGVFLAAGSLAAFAFGHPFLVWLLGELPFDASLLP
jgi:leader peptidase (prepilin peptidase) / N-methyltransferase